MTVEVGGLWAHPNERAHFIEFIELYADQAYLGRMDFTAVTTCPKATFCVVLAGPVEKLVAYERCNLHGVWTSEVPVEVSQEVVV